MTEEQPAVAAPDATIARSEASRTLNIATLVVVLLAAVRMFSYPLRAAQSPMGFAQDDSSIT